MVDVSLNEVEVGRGLPQVAHHHDQRPADLNGQRVIKKETETTTVVIRKV